MTDEPTSGSPTAERLQAATDILAALTLSAAALFSTWASYQAALWDGEQAAAYARASAARVTAGVLDTENGEVRVIDLVMFSQWLDAFAEHNSGLQDFYRARFRPEFARAFESWTALHPEHDRAAPSSPFAMKQYRPHLKNEAQEMNRRADKLFEQGQHANAISDAFVQATVFLALALFLGGIGQTFQRLVLKLLITVLAALACIAGVAQLTALPGLQLG